MATIYLKRKFYTQYDETDSLKRMKDSDVLAEKKRRTGGWGDVAAKTLVGAGVGAGVAAGGAALYHGVTGAMGASKKVGAFKGATGALGKVRWGRAAGIGAGIGAAAMGLSALHKRQKKANENKFYNDRLEYAQRQALRRERADWKSNMTNREGYSY